jgi:Fe-S cluster assembly iron-binding protein IscA
MEKDTEKAIIIVNIDNKNRINATITEDYFLVDIQDYQKAVDAFDDTEEMVFTTSGAMQILSKAGIDYERILEGQKFFFKNNAAAVTFDYESDEPGCED